MSLTIQTTDEFDPTIPMVLPHEKVYSIQVGYKLFRLSGLSLSSDAPSYFTNYFSDPENEDKVLFFDRNPVIFEKIYNHLQGYSVNINNDYDFVHLWSDCFYFGLKRLQKLLTEYDIFSSVGNVSFKIPKSLFMGSEGNCPNFFTMQYDRLLINNLNIIERNNMLRPPPQTPAIVANRSPLLFSDILELLRGNTSIVRDEEHRKLLIKECRYYRFLELEQKLIKVKILNDAIIIDLFEITKKGTWNKSKDKSFECPLFYKRPYITEPSRELIVQINSTVESSIKLVINSSKKVACIKFTNKLATKIASIFKEYLENVLQDENSLTFLVGFKNSKSIIDGDVMNENWVNEIMGIDEKDKQENNGSEQGSKKRKLSEECKGEIIEINITKSLWKIMMRGKYSRLHAVLINGTTSKQEEVTFLV
ncbi:unnamed protein product [Candida verbasci]|uniref:Potassium channel tetramerisation-type BTB domain-containing protein n=1 Tax=Candida verbasci TaxID=1227364 RepID=A0A9W4TZM5_9ASCO|nr:unnamed protein product [Candida verbasci]